ncbi:hypothetical protein BC938DRAFT_479682 [Jimgerdemannia flammicorona]|uniref:von Hippel-Lindau disease tumour suppressor beta domain-containing protein n=1 Tax=Jimgerdemannia flammicorona TaxID=994334 RepID=A0A433QKD5_9FUNG|nr:hypothetical protein BC938DRAFT_479682 [Jimgerdemannia flammicorona]
MMIPRFALAAFAILSLFATSDAYCLKPQCMTNPCKTVQVQEPAKTITFVNVAKISIYIYWLDWDGKYTFYKLLAPGESYDQQTYEHHVWAISTSNGNSNTYPWYYQVDKDDSTVPLWIGQ